MAVGVGRGQQLGQVAGHLIGLARCGLGALPLPKADRQAGAEAGAQQQRGDRQLGVAAQPEPAAMAPVVPTGADRAVLQPALQIVDQRADAAVALARLLAHGLGRHRLQIAPGALEVGRPARPRPLALGRQRAARKPCRLGVEHRMFECGARATGLAEGQHAAEQLVQHHAQRVDIGRDADGRAGDLLGRGIGRCQAAAGLAGQLAVGAGAVVVEQAGDAEVQQLRAALGRHHHIAGLEVAVHDQLRMGMLDRPRHPHQQAHPLGHRQPGLAHMLAERQPRHMLQHQIGAAAAGLGLDAGVQQARNARMGQPRQQRTLACEALGQARRRDIVAQQLDRDLGLVEPVGALGQPDLAHAALAQLGHQAPGAQPLASCGATAATGLGRQRPGQALL
ncbi:hypothetical protein PO768_28610, partial [Paucibacter sp. XJ19-41]